jgi:hypothetical protein
LITRLLISEDKIRVCAVHRQPRSLRILESISRGAHHVLGVLHSLLDASLCLLIQLDRFRHNPLVCILGHPLENFDNLSHDRVALVLDEAWNFTILGVECQGFGFMASQHPYSANGTPEGSRRLNKTYRPSTHPWLLIIPPV